VADRRRVCAHPTCEASYDAHKWGAIHAHTADWFEQKDGRVWCPDHHPDWVAGWRDRQSAEAAALEVDRPPCPSCFTVPAKNGTCSC
jgi:hypothetical protein